MLDLTPGTLGHASARVPGSDRIVIRARGPSEFGVRYTTAEQIIDVDADGRRLQAANDGFAAPLEVHIHTEIGMAIAGLKHGLRMVSQQAIRFYNRTGYHAYEGITEDFEERARINRDLGQNRAMIMHNHGLLTVGKNAREAFVLMKTLVEAADIQLRMEATGGELIEIPSQICESTAAQYQTHDSGRGSADWPAFLRIADQIDPSYRN